jgi:integrase
MARAKRRGNGEGTIYKRADGRYMGQVSLPNGKRKSVYGKTRAVVAKKLSDVFGAVKDGAPVPNERRTVADYLREWQAVHGRTLRGGTRWRYAALISVQICPRIGKKRLCRLTTGEVNALYLDMQANGCAPASIRQTHAILRKAFRDAERLELVARNVVQFASPPKLEASTKVLECLDDAGIRTFLKVARHNRLYAFYVVALSHGLRLGELLGLQWDAVDFERGVLHVRHQLQRKRAPRGDINRAGSWEFVPPKTKRSRRRIRLSQTAIAELRAHRARQNEERLRVGPAWDGSWGLVFSNRLGEPLHGTSVLRQNFRPLLAAAGLDASLTLHSLRHTYATQALGVHNVPVHVVSQVLGHSNVSTTLNVYAHVLPDMQERAAAASDAMLG